MEPFDVEKILNALEAVLKEEQKWYGDGFIVVDEKQFVVSLREQNSLEALAKYNPQAIVRKNHVAYLKLQGDVRKLPEEVYGLSYLVCLDLNNTGFDAPEQLEFLSNLKVVDLSRTKVRDLQWMQRLPLLEDARLQDTPVADLKGAESAPFLKKLVLYNAPINWESPLSQKQLLYLVGRGVDVGR
jgi:hypothetical protein